MKVTLLGSYGTEETICQQAGMSSGKETADVTGMVTRLLNWKHMKPFEICSMHLEVTLPISADRQLATYRTLVGSIAQSGRYGSTSLEFYRPYEFDYLDQVDQNYWLYLEETLENYYTSMTEKYAGRFEGKHRAREVFRDLLPQGQLTTRRFQVNLRNLLHFLDERGAKGAQPEIRRIAQEMQRLMGELWPTVGLWYKEKK